MRTGVSILMGALLLVAACSPEADPTSTTTTVTSTVSPSTSLATTTTEPLTTSTTTTGPQIDVTYADGQVVGPDRVEYTVGDEVSLWVLSDSDEEIHVHGYDVFFEAGAGVPLHIVLTADAPGIFEVELESSHTLLLELEVTP